MNDLSKTLVLKKPAVIVRPQAPTVLMVAGRMERWKLMAEASKLAGRGVIAVEGDRGPAWNANRNRWELEVRPLKRPAPRWRKPALVLAGAAAVLGTVFALGWWFLTALTTTALGSFLGFVALAFVAWLIYSRKATDVTVTTVTHVRVRR